MRPDPRLCIFSAVSSTIYSLPKETNNMGFEYAYPSVLSACVRGIMLICSTPDHNLDFHEVYYSPGNWLGPIIAHDWAYQGRVYDVFGLKRRRRGRAINSAAIENLSGPFDEGYASCNYDGQLTHHMTSYHFISFHTI